MTEALSAQSAGASREYPLEWKNHIRVTDYVMIGCTAVHHLIMLGVVTHLVWRRDWPPYVTKNVTLVSAPPVMMRVLALIPPLCALLEANDAKLDSPEESAHGKLCSGYP